MVPNVNNEVLRDLFLQQPKTYDEYISDIRIFLDMDGVTANLTGGIAKVTNMPPGEWDDNWVTLHAANSDLFLTLDPLPGLSELMIACRNVTFQIEALTAIPMRWSWPNITKHKREWNWLIHGKDFKTNFGPYAEDKQYWCTGMTDILIDDNLQNIAQWRSRGGTAIYHTSVEETIYWLRIVTQHWVIEGTTDSIWANQTNQQTA